MKKRGAFNSSPNRCIGKNRCYSDQRFDPELKIHCCICPQSSNKRKIKKKNLLEATIITTTITIATANIWEVRLYHLGGRNTWDCTTLEGETLGRFDYNLSTNGELDAIVAKLLLQHRNHSFANVMNLKIRNKSKTQGGAVALIKYDNRAR